MDFPVDLLDLQRAFFDLDQRCRELAAQLPDPRDLILNRVDISREDLDARRRAWDEARAERLQVVMELNRHGWWASQPDRQAASFALQEAARGQRVS